ncbi:MAG: hypothetical protein PHT84_02250 [Candidatus Pacebacteria bacterium]|nr:hypothetical protein [Candidatus Paceibacterota bacterium]
MDDKRLIIFGKGINGSTSYSIFQDNPRVPVITDKDLEKISKEFVRLYPELAKKIKRHQNDFSAEIPEELTLRLEPTAKASFLEEISKKIV